MSRSTHPHGRPPARGGGPGDKAPPKAPPPSSKASLTSSIVSSAGAAAVDVKMSDEVDEEIQALRSIYDTDFIDGPPVWNCPSFTINCRPAIPSKNEESEILAAVKFTLPKSYPRAAPTLKIENYKGIAKKEVAELETLLNDTASTLVGSVMCYDLASASIAFLETRVPKSGNLYEDMLSRQNRERVAMQTIVSSQPAKASTSTINNLKLDTHPTENARKDMLRRPSVGSEYSESDSEDELVRVQNKPTRPFSDESAEQNMSDYRKTKEESDDSDSSDDGSDSDSTDSSDEESSSEDSSEDDVEEAENEVSATADQSETKSRYKDEFEQLSLLGRGAFGEVWSCKNNLDTRTYAMKKIIIMSSNAGLNAKIRREVTTISHLWHKHIVRYYAAWVESITNADDLDSKLDESEDSLFDSSWTGEDLDDSDDEEPSRSGIMRTDSLDGNSLRQVLYIQMEYCQTTLRAVLDEGNLWTQLHDVTTYLRQVIWRTTTLTLCNLTQSSHLADM
jgi:hypothetical protein